MSHSTLRGVKNLDTLNALPSQWASNFSAEIHVTAAVDTVAPVTPSSFAVNGIAEGITLTWVNPTLNDDGTNCYDLSDIAVYRSTSASIDITNAGTYTKKTLVDGEAYTFPASDTTQTYYFVITAIDTSGNESTASAELSDTSNKPIGGDPVIPDDATGKIFNDAIPPPGGDGIVTGYAMIGIAFQTPPSTVQGLRSIRLWFQYTDDAGTNWRDEDGVATQWTELFPEGLIGFLHKDVLLQTNIGTRAYRYKATFIGEDDTTESSTADTAGGTATVCALNNDNLVAISIFAMNIVCLGEVVADSIKASTITADKLSFTAYVIGTNSIDDVVDGATYSRVLKTDISAGHILLSEATGTLDNIGDGATYSKVLKTDISAGHILLTEATGDLDDITDGDNFKKVASTDIDAGHITVVSSSASININSAVWQNQGIQLQYNAGTPRAYMGDGGVTSGDRYFMFDGANISFRGVNTSLTAAGLFSCSNIVITGAGSTWGGAKIAQANIANLTTAIITSGTFSAVRIPNIAFDTITAATNTASLVIGGAGSIASSNYSAGSAGFKIDGDGDAEFNDVTVRGNLQAGVGSDVDWGFVSGVAIEVGDISINGDMQFYDDSARHAIMGINGLYYATNKSTASPHILINSGNIQIKESVSGSAINIDAGFTIVGTSSVGIFTSGVMTLTPGTGTKEAVTGIPKYSGDQIFSGAAPSTSYDLLTLTTWLPTGTRCLCYIKVVNGGASQNTYSFKTYGESENQADGDFYGAGSCKCGYTDELGYAWVLTDSSARISWKSNDTDSVVLTMLFYFVCTG